MVLDQKQCFDSLETPWNDFAGEEFFETRGNALGTKCRMLFSAPSRASANSFRAQVSEWIHSFEMRYSRFIETSIISQINSAAGIKDVEIDAELISIFKLCDWFHWSSRGIFDPTMLPLSLLWDYHSDAPQVPNADSVNKTRLLVNWKDVIRNENRLFLPKKNMALDIGGIGKEYAVDRVIGMAQDAGFLNAMIDFGHDIRVIGNPPEGGGWRIGLENPQEPSKCWSGAALSDIAIASSGNYARGFNSEGKRYGHIIDPRTGYPSDNGSLSVSVIAPTCTEAGILATAALVLGEDEFINFMGENHQAEGCMVTKNGIIRTPGFLHYEIPSTTTYKGGQ